MAMHTEGGPLKIGSRLIDKYEIKALLGKGGQAWVYRGQHVFTRREVAIKIIHSAYGVTNEMLVRATAEAQALGRLSHENVVIMHDAGVTEEGQLYIVMELLVGSSLRTVLAERGRLEVEETLRLAIQAGDAVHEAHKERMIHRDLKPDNLFVTRGNGLKVLDFGIAKMLDEIGFTTRKDVVVGTVLYMSPEQVQGLPITEQSDIYALGLILFEALIGKQPSVLIFERDLIERGEPHRRAGIADIPPIQANRIPPLITELDPEIPIYVARLVQRAIAKLAKQRFSTMGDFTSAMRVCLDTYLQDVPQRVRRPSGRDLSLPAAKQPEVPPVSQRVTAKRSVSVSPADAPIGVETQPIGTRLVPSEPPLAPKAEPATITPRPEPQSERAISQPPASGPLEPATLPPVTVSPGHTQSDVARTNRVKVRNALVSGSLLGVALGTAVMLHFAPTHAASRPPAILDAAAAVAASPYPIAPAPPATPEGIHPAEPQLEAAAAVASALPSPAAPARPPPNPVAHATPSPARAAASKPSDKPPGGSAAQSKSSVEPGQDQHRAIY
jgi:serine/threonine-protein kinase